MNENDKYENKETENTEPEKINFSESEIGGMSGEGFSDQNAKGDTSNQSNSGGQSWGANPYSKYRGANNQSFEGQNPYSSYHRNGQNAATRDEPLSVVDFDASGAKRNFTVIGAGFALFILISTVVSLIIQLVGMSINESLISNIWFVNLITPVALYLFALPILLILLSKVPETSFEGKRMRIGEWIVYFLIGFGLMYIGSFISEYVMSYLSQLTGKDYSNALNDLIDFNNLGNLWITALFTVIIAPIGEEFVFRKLIIDRTRKYGAVVSIVLSALMFGLMHGNFYQFFYAFLLGLVLGYMYYTTGKLLPVISMHAAINFFGSVVTVLLSHGLDLEALESADMAESIAFIAEHGVQFMFLMIFTLFAYACMACAVIIPIVSRKKIVLERGEMPIPRAYLGGVLIVNAGMIIMWVVFAIQFALSLI